MAQQHRPNVYRDDSWYHVYNRGYNKELLFRDEKDYWAFRRFLRKSLKNVESAAIEIFALLPNHFHLLVHTMVGRDLTRLMRSIGVSYTMYFQRKYQFSGRIFCGSYKAELVTNARHRQTVEKYILDNPMQLQLARWKHVGREL